MEIAKQLKNIELRKGKDGFWLSVKASNGRYGSICLNNMKDLVGTAFFCWAKDQFKEDETCSNQ